MDLKWIQDLIKTAVDNPILSAIIVLSIPTIWAFVWNKWIRKSITGFILATLFDRMIDCLDKKGILAKVAHGKDVQKFVDELIAQYELLGFKFTLPTTVKSTVSTQPDMMLVDFQQHIQKRVEQGKIEQPKELTDYDSVKP
jgi:hypothetical protein